MNALKEIYQYRELLKSNIKKEIRGKYKGSTLGILWSFLNPLLLVMVYAVVFPLILKNNQPNYVVFLIVALLPWTFFTTVLPQSASTIIVNANIIKKVYFPREILPISVTTSNLVNFLISSLIIFLALIISGIGFSKYILFFPVIVLVQYLVCLACAFILSAVTVYLRDIEHLISVLINVLFYATPIVYSLSDLPPKFAGLLKLNPMATIITAYRDCLFFQQMPDLTSLGILAVIAFIGVVVGYHIFKHLEKNFGEEL